MGNTKVSDNTKIDQISLQKTSAERLAEKSRHQKSVWPPALIFFVLTLLTILMALALKALVTGSVRF